MLGVTLAAEPVSLAQAPKDAAEKVAYPRRFGNRYVLLKEIGQGGMGTVFMALSGQAGLERVSALKIIKDLQAGRDADDLSQRFMDEAKVVTKLSHENLVFVFDFGIVKRQGYLAMEYVPGKTLTEVWNRCAVRSLAFPQGVSLFLVGELASALGYAHGLQGMHLIHRDVSPSNLMLSYTGGLKLIDFGLAKWKSKVSQTAAGINWGKISYMSPEQYTGKPMDHRSDLYSAAVILWELLTGRQLYPNEQARREMTEILPPSRINGHVSGDLDTLVLKALAAAPGDRFQSGEELCSAINRLIPRDSGKLRVADFLRDLFEADIRAEAATRDALVSQAANLQPVPEVAHDRPSTSSPIAMAPDPILGTVLADRYFVRKLIGEGAMGRVYEGHHTGVGRRVAIKIPRHAERRKAELLQRFKLEANAASQIGHPNIADVTDCGTTPKGDFFFVMEFIDGIEVDKLVRREGPLPLERTALIGIQICRALEAAHKAGIIHRDLKPSNVMLVRDHEDDVVKVLDFGVAKFLRAETGPPGTPNPELTMSDAAVGTPRYMAPEQIAVGAEVDFRTDIYAVGGILYFMLSGGQPPIGGDDVDSVWRNKLNSDPTPVRHWRSDIPNDFAAVVMRCLARDPVVRPETMEELKRFLLESLEHVRAAGSSVLGARMPSSTAMVRGSAIPGRWRKGIAAGAAVALVGIASWAWYGRPAQITAPRNSVGAGASSTTQDPVAGPATIDPPTAPTSLHAPPSVPTQAVASSPPVPAAPKTHLPAATPHSSPSAGRAAPTMGAGKSLRASAVAPASLPAGGAGALVDEAEDLFNRGAFVAALVKAQKAVAAGAGVPAQLLVGSTHYQMEQFSEAAAAFEAALRADPVNAAARRGLTRARAALRNK